MLFRMYGRCRYLLRTAKLPSHISVATDHECFVVSLASEVGSGFGRVVFILMQIQLSEKDT